LSDLLHWNRSPDFHAIPPSIKKFRSENNKPDLINANFSGPVNGIRNSKLAIAIRGPIKSNRRISPVDSKLLLSYPRIICGYPIYNGYSRSSSLPTRAYEYKRPAMVTGL